MFPVLEKAMKSILNKACMSALLCGAVAASPVFAAGVGGTAGGGIGAGPITGAAGTSPGTGVNTTGSVTTPAGSLNSNAAANANAAVGLSSGRTSASAGLGGLSTSGADINSANAGNSGVDTTTQTPARRMSERAQANATGAENGVTRSQDQQDQQAGVNANAAASGALGAPVQ